MFVLYKSHVEFSFPCDIMRTFPVLAVAALAVLLVMPSCHATPSTKSVNKELSEEEITAIYCQKKGESLDAYFKRIVAKTEYTSTIDSYLKILNIVRRNYATLDLWYDTKYIDFVKEYYTALYVKASSESEEDYYSRIIKKESWESEEQYARRIIIVRDLFPRLPLWTEEKYFEKYTKSLYALVFKKRESECEEDYIKRLLVKDSFFDRSDEIWAKRLFFIQQAIISSSIWYEEKYFQYIKNFYKLCYKKLDKETSDIWLTRILTPFKGESFDQAIKRIRFIKKVTGDCGCWKSDIFKKIKATNCFQPNYLCKIEKEFFSSESFFQSHTSHSTSHSSSYSSSGSGEETKTHSTHHTFEKKSSSSSSEAQSESSSHSSESILVRRG